MLQCWAKIVELTVTSKAALSKINEVQGQIKALHHLITADKATRLAEPKDLIERFAREVGQLCQSVSRTQLAAASRKFDPLKANGPLAHAARDKTADALPARFTREEEFVQNVTAQLGATSAAHILRFLNNNPDQGDKPWDKQ